MTRVPSKNSPTKSPPSTSSSIRDVRRAGSTKSWAAAYSKLQAAQGRVREDCGVYLRADGGGFLRAPPRARFFSGRGLEHFTARLCHFSLSEDRRRGFRCRARSGCKAADFRCGSFPIHFTARFYHFSPSEDRSSRRFQVQFTSCPLHCKVLTLHSSRDRC